MNQTPDLLETGSPSSAAQALLRVVLARYAAFTNYRDEGLLLVHLPGEHAPFEVPFRTDCATPNRFRFQFDFPHPHPSLRLVSTRYVVGCDGQQAYFHTAVPQTAPELRLTRTLGLALAGSTGLACGAAHTIAQLMLPGLRASSIAALTELRLDGSRVVDGIACHRVLGTHPYGGPHELLIGREDLLLRKLSKRSANMQVDEIRHGIELDAEPATDAFQLPA